MENILNFSLEPEGDDRAGGPGMMGDWGIGWFGRIFLMAFWILGIVGLVFLIRWLVHTSKGDRAVF